MPSQMLSPKRKAIVDSSRTMFIWVAAMSAIIGVCLVISIFLIQQIMFKSKVVQKMTETSSTLSHNNKVASELTTNVVVLETNAALNTTKANPDEKALQVVLDSLPDNRNALALGASLQQSLLTGVEGLTIDSLSVDNSNTSTSLTPSDKTIPIQLQVSAKNVNTIKDMLTRMERSIRIIDIDNFILEHGDSSYQATIMAHAYYEPAKQVELKEVVVPVGDKKR